MAAEGIGDPMLTFPHLHALLDATENIIMSGFYDPKDPKKAERERDRFLDALYKPTPESVKVNGDGYKPVPAGFEDGGEETFDWAMISTGAE